jgi:hypothetical protein
MDSQDDTKDYYERTLIQFRDLVIKLQEDLTKLKATQIDESKEDLIRPHQQVLSLNLQLMNTTQQVRSKALEIELKKIEAVQAAEQLEYIKVILFISLLSHLICFSLIYQTHSLKKNINRL